ncbi:MAG: type II toxin-antitoxin system PemK/MazF family toxin [Oscillospiraceae bacterium]|jgi:mRNA interferase MazF|nr:type II toxin-antitoxin system PemK/MazF family toxin [Oscillospiraceae bacterium]
MVRQGDIIRLNFSSTSGHEQSGVRPAVVISNDFTISKTNVVYVAPITSTIRHFPLHVPLDERTKTTGVILCEQVRAADLEARRVTRIERLPDDLLERVLDCVIGCLNI